jgi:hypothetical protein
MKLLDIIKATIPGGPIWKPIESGMLNKIYDAIGDVFQKAKTEADNLYNVRDPYLTTQLNDLERDYGLINDTNIDEENIGGWPGRRKLLSIFAFGKNGNGGQSFLQARLRAAGFNVSVNQNSPAIDPNEIIGSNYRIYLNGENAYLGNENCTLGEIGGELLVDGVNESKYTVPSDQRWNYVFFIGGAATGWYLLDDWDMELKNTNYWDKNIDTIVYKDGSHKNTGQRSLLVRDAYNIQEQEPGVIDHDPELITALTFYDLQQDIDIPFDPYSGTQTDLIIDGNMELDNLDNWETYVESGEDNTELDKTTEFKHSGIYGLEIFTDDSAISGATNSCLEKGNLYFVEGYARGLQESSIKPVFRHNDIALWTGIPSTDADTWQYFSVIFEAENNNIQLSADRTSSFVYFDDIKVYKIENHRIKNIAHINLLNDGNCEYTDASFWTAGNSATLSKETGDFYKGTKSLKVNASSAIAFGYAYQPLKLETNKWYRLIGYGKASTIDGFSVKVNGTSTSYIETDWTNFSILFQSNNIETNEIQFINNTDVIDEYSLFDHLCVQPLMVEEYNNIPYLQSYQGEPISISLSYNYIPDGKCDEVSAFAWESVNGSILSKDSSIKTQGLYSLDVEYSSVRTAVKQSNIMDIGSEYLLTGSVRNREIGINNNIEILNGTDIIYQSQDESNEWEDIYIKFIASDTDLQIQSSDGDLNMDFKIDNFVLTKLAPININGINGIDKIGRYLELSEDKYVLSSDKNSLYKGFCLDTWIRTQSENGSILSFNDSFELRIHDGKLGVYDGYTADEISNTTTGFAGCCFDGTHVWFAPYDSDYFVKINISNDSVTLISNTYGNSSFCGCCFDGTHVWFAPYDSDYFVKIDVSDDSITQYEKHVSFGTNSFDGCVSVADYVYFSPRDTQYAVRVKRSDGVQNSIAFNYGLDAFNDICFDGDFLWYCPMNSSYFVKVHIGAFDETGIDPGELIEIVNDKNRHGYGSAYEGSFEGCCFDGTHVWFAPCVSDYFVKINISTNEIIEIENTYSNYATYGCCFDGTHVWFTPGSSHKYIKIRIEDDSISTVLDHDYGWYRRCVSSNDGNIWFAPIGANEFIKIHKEFLFDSDSNINTGEWINIIANLDYSGSNIDIYLDGVLDKSSTEFIQIANKDLVFGGGFGDYDFDIQHFSLYSFHKSFEDIWALYQRHLSVWWSGQILHEAQKGILNLSVDKEINNKKLRAIVNLDARNQTSYFWESLGRETVLFEPSGEGIAPYKEDSEFSSDIGLQFTIDEIEITDINTDNIIGISQTNVILTGVSLGSIQGKLYLANNITFSLATITVEQTTINSWSDTEVDFDIDPGTLID